MKTAIILGNKLKDDGSLSEAGKFRLKLFEEFFKVIDFEKIILSGGMVNERAKISEAEGMGKELAKRGIPHERIVREDRSKNTVENAKFTLAMCRAMGAEEIFVITSKEHCSRKYMSAISIFEKERVKYADMTIRYLLG